MIESIMRLFETSKRKPTVNLTPLIDILFILIIFFVVSSKIIGDQGIGLTLPESSHGQDQPLNLPVLIVTADQQLLLNDQLVLKENLEISLTQLEGAPTTLIFKIDKSIPHGTVIGLMDLAKSVGFQKVVFGTESLKNKL